MLRAPPRRDGRKRKSIGAGHAA